MSGDGELKLRSYVLFSGSGPVLILTSFAELFDHRLISAFHHKGIDKFIANELPIERVRDEYGATFDVISAGMSASEELRILDFSGHHIFAIFALEELGPPIHFEATQEARPS